MISNKKLPPSFWIFICVMIAIAIAILPHHKAGLRSNIVDPKGVAMVLIPAGEFVMGSSADIGYAECMEILDGKGCARYFFTNEEPVHRVYLDDYYMDTTEVSNANYLPCVEEGACKPPYYVDTYTRDEYFYSSEFADYPVTSVTWEQAQAYCSWRSGSLPTEAQWEKAARGTDARIYPWGNEFDKKKVNICENNCPIPPKRQTDSDNFADTAPVNSFPDGTSPYGLLNMAGNVWEWVFDWYDPFYYRVSPEKNPPGPASGPSHIRRGGGWMSSGSFIRTTVRSMLLNDPLVHYAIGFRCARPSSGSH